VKQFPDSNGMLLVRQVFPGGAGEGKLEEGDILLSINDEPLSNFVKLAELLDSSIGKTLSFQVIRRGQPQSVEIEIQDLEALQPSKLIELGDSTMHNVSVQRARAMNLPQSGVVLAKSGYEFSRAGVPRGALITNLNGKTIATVDDLLEHAASASDEQEWRLRYVMPGSEYTSAVAIVKVSSKWFGARACDQRDNTRFWSCEQIELPAKPKTTEPLESAVLPNYQDNRIQSVASSLVRLSFDIPYLVDNVYASNFSGVGLVVDPERGLIVTDRNTVPVELGDLEITFFSAYKIPGEVVFLHPLHNIAILKYDPSLLGDVEMASLPMADSFPSLETELEMIGYRNDGTIRKQKVSSTSEVTLYFNTPRLTRFQQIPLDVLNVTLGGPTLGGVLLDDDNTIQAVWQSFAYQDGDEMQEGEWAMPAFLIQETLQQYLSGDPYYLAPAKFEYNSLAEARERGLPNDWIAKISATGAVHRRVIAVTQIVSQNTGQGGLMVGDILLAIEGEIPTNFQELEAKFQKPSVNATVLRDGQVVDIQSATMTYQNDGTKRMVVWAGSLIQEPHFELQYQRDNRTQGVFIVNTLGGSPSIQDQLYRNRFITAVEGVPVDSLDKFIAEVSSKDPEDSINLTVVAMNGYRSVVSVQPEYNFWPTIEIALKDGEWTRTKLSEDLEVAVE